MKIFLNDNKIDTVPLTVNSGLNYGRFSEQTTHEYEIHLSKAEFYSFTEKEYMAIRDEIKKDDQTYNDTSDFKATNYCSLPELFSFKNEFDSIFKTYIDRDLLQKFFHESPDNQFVINSTDAIWQKEDAIVIRARAFER